MALVVKRLTLYCTAMLGARELRHSQVGMGSDLCNDYIAFAKIKDVSSAELKITDA